MYLNLFNIVQYNLGLIADSRQFDDTEKKLDEADAAAAQTSPVRKSHSQVFRAARKRILYSKRNVLNIV
jgi:hypothetical protein